MLLIIFDVTFHFFSYYHCPFGYYYYDVLTIVGNAIMYLIVDNLPIASLAFTPFYYAVFSKAGRDGFNSSL